MAEFLDVEQVVPPQTIEVTSADGKTKSKGPNPEFSTRCARDQQVFSYLLTSLPLEMAIQVATCHTAAELWNTVQGMLASHTRARTVNVRIALANLQKGNSSITDYVGKIRALCDELMASGKKVDEEDVVSHILAGLDEEFDPVVSAMCSRVEPVTVPELYSQLLSFETRMSLRGGSSQSSANAATPRSPPPPLFLLKRPRVAAFADDWEDPSRRLMRVSKLSRCEYSSGTVTGSTLEHMAETMGSNSSSSPVRM